jgi:hypothetical protein
MKAAVVDQRGMLKEQSAGLFTFPSSSNSIPPSAHIHFPDVRGELFALQLVSGLHPRVLYRD